MTLILALKKVFTRSNSSVFNRTNRAAEQVSFTGPGQRSLSLSRLSLIKGLCVIVAVYAVSATAMAQSRFQENDGLLVIDVESVPAAGQWSAETSLPDFLGRSYYIWRGDNNFNPARAGQGTMRFNFRIENPGNYRLRWRSRIGKGNLGSEYNDSWVRFPTGRNVPGEHGINGWTKIYQGQLNRWSWDSWTVDFNPMAIRQFFGRGDHFFEISGRSTGHALDRVVLHMESIVPFSESRFVSAPESRRTNGSSPEPTPAPEPEPTPAPVAQPAPEPEPAPAPVAQSEPEPPVVIQTVSEPVVVNNDSSSRPAAPVAVRADVYSTTAAELFWARGGPAVVSYDVHRNGSFLDSTNGSSYFMQDLSPGASYDFELFAIAADGGVSQATQVSLQTRQDNNQSGNLQPVDNAPASPANASLVVYSSTAAELFWDRASTIDNVVATDVYRDGLFIGVSPGNSYFDDTRQPGEQYEYQLFARNGSDTASSPTTVSE